MSSIETDEPEIGLPSRRRLPWEERHRQLIDVAWRLIGEEGTDALTLGRLAEQAGVTKPVVYDHFGTRAGLLAALYREFDTRQTELMDSALAASGPALADKATVIASTYMDCILRQGREIPGVIAALAGSPELEKVRRECEALLMEKCRAILAPFAASGDIAPAGLRAVLGAASALSCAAVDGDITPQEAQAELVATVAAVIARNG